MSKPATRKRRKRKQKQKERAVAALKTASARGARSRDIRAEVAALGTNAKSLSARTGSTVNTQATAGQDEVLSEIRRVAREFREMLAEEKAAKTELSETEGVRAPSRSSAEGTQIRRQESDEWARIQQENRKTTKTLTESVIRLTDAGDRSWERRVLLGLAFVCVMMMFLFGLIAVLRENPWYVTGSVVSFFFPAGGALWVRSMGRGFAESAKGEPASQGAAYEERAFPWSSSLPAEPLSEEQG